MPWAPEAVCSCSTAASSVTLGTGPPADVNNMPRRTNSAMTSVNGEPVDPIQRFLLGTITADSFEEAVLAFLSARFSLIDLPDFLVID